MLHKHVGDGVMQELLEAIPDSMRKQFSVPCRHGVSTAPAHIALTLGVPSGEKRLFLESQASFFPSALWSRADPASTTSDISRALQVREVVEVVTTSARNRLSDRETDVR